MSMADAKVELKKEFGKDFHKYYWVPLFDEYGYERHTCKNCGKTYWAIENSPDADICPDTTCTKYSFIGQPNGKPMDYIETWKAIEKFFVKNGHVSVPSYPVIARWFPGMYFTLASIVAFQRSVHGKTVFEMPHDRIIIPQTCLRFNDIPNVGVTGRHMTNFVMVGQHSLYDKNKPNTYWKEKCAELDFELLTSVFKVKPEEIKWMEDVWVGPNTFGYSLEYYVKGLELGNAVFTEFIGTPDNYKPMGQKVIDMGAGLERFTWYSQGTPTAYDAVYGPVIKKMKTYIDYNKSLFEHYSKISGTLDVDETSNITKERMKIATELGVSLKDLQANIESLEAVYAITDHAKTLLYAITDGGLPSNVGGGYNLRVILRRALAFMDKLELDIPLQKVCEWHANYLKRMTPRLKENLKEVNEIIEIETQRYRVAKDKSNKIISQILDKKEKITPERITQLYESEGITPELIRDAAKLRGQDIKISDDFYSKLSEQHMASTKIKEKNISLDLKGLPYTEMLFRNESLLDFKAKVLRVTDGWVILDKTTFYAEAGGQDHDLGTINHIKVDDVQKFGNIIAHKLSSAISLKSGMEVNCEIDSKRRKQLMQHHTAVHLINAASRTVLGNHVWQGGTSKSVEKAHLDITHHSSLSEAQVDKIEALANKMIEKNLKIEKTEMERQEAENKYGMRIYQGGAVPDHELRIVTILDGDRIIDAEACGGTHVNNTSYIEEIVITSTERIQDGLVRITLVAGSASRKYREREAEILSESKSILQCKEEELVDYTKELFAKWKKVRKENKKIVSYDNLEKQIKGSINILEANVKELMNISNKHKGIFFGTKDKSVIITMDGAGEIIKALSEIGVKGGGRDNFAQGRYEKEPNEEDIKIIKRLVGLR